MVRPALCGKSCWRNQRAEPKTNFAPNSPIRTWAHYPTKAA